MAMEHIMCVSREVMMEMFVLIKGEPSEPYVCGSQAADRTFLLAAEEPLLWINKREIG